MATDGGDLLIEKYIYSAKKNNCSCSCKSISVLEFHIWKGKAIFILQRVLILENLKVYGNILKGAPRPRPKPGATGAMASVAPGLWYWPFHLQGPNESIKNCLNNGCCNSKEYACERFLDEKKVCIFYRYLLLPALLGSLSLQLVEEDRLAVVERGKTYYKDFLGRCRQYGVTQEVGPPPFSRMYKLNLKPLSNWTSSHYVLKNVTEQVYGVKTEST